MTETTAAAAPSDTAAPADAPARGTLLASVGLLMAAAGPLLLLVASVLWGLEGDDVAFFAVTGAVALLGAVLVRRRRTAWKVVAVVLAVLVAGALFWTAFGLALPSSFLDFVPGLLVIPGVLIALGAGITAIRSGKRGRTVSGGERRAAAVIVGALGLLAVVSAVLTVTGRDTVADADAADADVVVDLNDFEFDQASYEATGETVVLVKNSDPFSHNFTIDALDIDVDLGPGSEKLVTLPAAEPGTYVMYCEPHTDDPKDPSDDDMAAELEVS